MYNPLTLFTILIACGSDLDKDNDGFTLLTGDCNEGDPNIHPAAVEICDGIDNDCNGETDELGARGGFLYYADIDGDGYGSSAATLEACSLPEGYSESKKDCDEGNPNNHPGADEICDGEDNDCDTKIDEYTAVDAQVWHPDLDGDGYGDSSISYLSCEAPPDYILDSSDCDDVDPNINPETRELCETAGDENCNGDNNDVDAEGCIDFYADLDADGYFGTSLCLCYPTEEYWQTAANDCDDSNPDIHPEQDDALGFGNTNCEGGTNYPIENAVAILSANSDASSHVPRQMTGGDFNGDGYADIAIGYGNVESIHLFYGPDIPSTDIVDSDVTIQGTSLDFGDYPLASFDNNGDGIDEIAVVSGSTNNMTTYLFQGPFGDSVQPEEAIATIFGSFNHGHQSIYAIGDVNGDGFGDLLWSAGLANVDSVGVHAGSNNIFYGPIEGDLVFADADLSIQGEQVNDSLGRFAEGVGDLNGDGVADVALGSTSSRYSSLGGSIRIFYSGSDHLLADTIIVTNSFYEDLGYNLAGKTDFDGDGYNDLIFGATNSDMYLPDSGRVHVLHGPFEDGEFDVMNVGGVRIYGEANADDASFVKAAGDIDGDGREDLLIGAKNNHFPELTTGSAVYVVFGEIGEGGRYLPDDAVKFPTDYNGLGDSKSTAGIWKTPFVSPGDVNGDGLNDILIAAKRTTELDPEQRAAIWLFWGMER